MNPQVASRVVVTYASSESSGGPVHGAAMMPPTRPIRNAPPRPRPPTFDSRACSPEGSAISNAPNIDRPMAAENTASGHTTQGLPRYAPNLLPVRPQMVPSAPNVTAIPATYADASTIARERRVPAFTPKIARVIGIIGYTQGLRPVSNPAPSARSTLGCALTFIGESDYSLTKCPA